MVLGMKKITAAVAAMLMLAPVAACGSYEDQGIDTGVVTKVDWTGRKVTVLEDDGETDKHHLSKRQRYTCAVGDRWPDCAK